MSADPSPGSRRSYQVRHATSYGYDDVVTASYGRAHLLPRDAPGQWCASTDVRVEPAPTTLAETEDYYGNRCAYLEVLTPHDRLVVVATSQVEVDRPVPDLSALDGWSVAQAAAAVGDWPEGSQGDPSTATDFLLPSRHVPLEPAREYATPVLAPGRPLGEAVADLVHRIYTDFTYSSGSTSVRTTMQEVLTQRRGVCQDFAHLGVACLRGVGLPARYVSGYLETRPPLGRPKLAGADASHAWLSVLLPELGWVDVDPTNDKLVDGSYVVTAWGRDYADVPPLKGVIFTQSTKRTLEVAVDVTRLDPAAAGLTGVGGPGGDR